MLGNWCRELPRFVATVVLAFAATAPVYAVDGLVLIDQNRALAGNVAPGDAPGFPISITQPGSYRLSGNLTVPNENTTAIVVSASNVTIDLNGFSIIGPAVAGSGFGIATSNDSPSPSVIRIQDGTITGMGSTAIQLFGEGNTIENVTIRANGSGMLVALATIRRNRVMHNRGPGISASNCVITDNLVSQNAGVGISANDSLIVNNVLVVNASLGVAAANSGFQSNVFSSNNGSFANPQFSGRHSMGTNLCDGNICQSP